MATKGKLNVDFALRYVGAIGANRYVANVDRYSTIEWKDIVFYAARAAHVPESSIEVAMDALYDALNYFVLNGHNVKIDGIGTFYFGINAGAEEAEEDAGAASVKRLKIGLLPEMSLRQALNNVAVTTTTSNPGNLLVDQSVPPKITDMGFGASSNGEFYIRSFGSEVKLINNQIYMRVYGQRMRRQMDVKVEVALYKDGSEVYTSEDVVATPLGVTTKYAAYLLTLTPPEDREFDTAYLQSVSVCDPTNNDNVYFWRAFATPEGSYIAEKIIANGKEFKLKYKYEFDEVPTFNAPAAENNTLEVYGANLNTEIGILDANYSVISYSKRKIVYSLTSFSNKGLVWMGVNGEGFNILYPVADGQPIVTALSANGVSAGNNSSSTIRQGESYNFVFTGSNLDGMTTANLNVPSGSTVKNFAASANKVSFTLDNAQAGDISLDYNGSALFRVTLVAYSGTGEGEVSITTIDSMSNGATYDVTDMVIGRAVRMSIEGSGLSNLENADFVQMRGNSKVSDVTFTLEEGEDTLRHFTWYGTFNSGDKLIIQKSGTTLFTLNITGTMRVEL